jgi:hypothetical protein
MVVTTYLCLFPRRLTPPRLRIIALAPWTSDGDEQAVGGRWESQSSRYKVPARPTAEVRSLRIRYFVDCFRRVGLAGRVWVAPVLATLLLGGAVSSSCGGGLYTPDTPAPQPPTPMPSPAINMAGKWTGTIESTNFPPHTISMDVVQSADCVDGSWASVPTDWAGAISGYAGASSYSGLMSIELRVNGAACNGTANISGEVGQNALKWTSTGFTGDCSGSLPQSIVLKLNRQ